MAEDLALKKCYMSCEWKCHPNDDMVFGLDDHFIIWIYR